jgi:hypothetical protein
VGLRLGRGGWVGADRVDGPRRVVALERERVYICRNDEYRDAANEGREPLCVGFKPVQVRAIKAQMDLE